MPRRFVTAKDRWVFLAIGSWAIVVSALMLVDESGADRVWGYPAWAGMLGLGGVLTLLFTPTMRSFRLRGLAAALMVVGCVGRGAGLLMGIARETVPTSAAGFLGIAVWTMLGFLVYFTWRSRVPGDPPEGANGWLDD